MIVHAGLAALPALPGHRVGGHGDDGQPRQAGVAADVAGGLEAVHLGHLEVHQDQVEGVRGAGLQHGDGEAPVVGHLHGGALLFEQAPGDELVDVVVFDQQDAQAGQRRRAGGRGRAGRRRLGEVEAEGEAEAAALAGCAVHVEVAAHLFDQVARDREPQARAAEAPGHRAVALGEGLEEARALAGVHADAGVVDGEAEGQPAGVGRAGFHLEPDLALCGELHRVAQQLGQHLPEAQRVADELRQPGRHGRVEGEALLPGPGGDRRDDPCEHLAGREGGGADAELAGFDAGAVEDVVHQAHQAAGGGLDLFEVVPLTRSRPGVEAELGEPQDGVQRGADLVADVGQEARLGLGGLLGEALGLAQGVEALALDGDLLDDPQAVADVGWIGAGGLQPADRDAHPQGAEGGALELAFPLPLALGGEGPGLFRAVVDGLAGPVEQLRPGAGEFVGQASGATAEARAGVFDAAVRAGDEEHRGAPLDRLGEAVQGLPGLRRAGAGVAEARRQAVGDEPGEGRQRQQPGAGGGAEPGPVAGGGEGEHAGRHQQPQAPGQALGHDGALRPIRRGGLHRRRLSAAVCRRS